MGGEDGIPGPQRQGGLLDEFLHAAYRPPETRVRADDEKISRLHLLRLNPIYMAHCHLMPLGLQDALQLLGDPFPVPELRCMKKLDPQSITKD